MTVNSFTQEKADDICRRLAAGEMMTVIVKTEGMPAMRTVSDWRKAHPEFKEAYDEAMLAGCYVLLEQTIPIVDDITEDAQSRRVRAWGRHEYIKRRRPDMFSEKTTTELTGAGGEPLFKELYIVAVEPPKT